MDETPGDKRLKEQQMVLFKVNATIIMAPLLKYPVVLIHGFVDIPVISGSWKVVENALDEMGVEHFTPIIPPFGSIEERSVSLIKQIGDKYPNGQVHLFGHSMGGLNARDLAAKDLLGFEIKTVTTFGTPHRGVKWDLSKGREGNSELSGSIRQIFRTDLGGAGNLSHRFMTEFNANTANNPKVKYFSWAGETEIPTPLYIAIFPLSRLFGPTDGLVNVDSAEWRADLGSGTHLGCVYGLDHFALLNCKTVLATIPHLSAAEHGQTAEVQPIDNSLIHSLALRIEGDINITLGPARAALGRFGLRF